MQTSVIAYGSRALAPEGKAVDWSQPGKGNFTI